MTVMFLYNTTTKEKPSTTKSGAEGGIWTHEPLRDRSLSPTPLAMLGDLRAC